MSHSFEPQAHHIVTISLASNKQVLIQCSIEKGPDA